MDGVKYKFLVGVLGEDGAKALAKAAERSERLENALLPRTILAWINIASRIDYEGELPGVENTYLRFAKSEQGYSGAIGVSENVYEFQDVSVYHVAAGIAVALGADSDKLDPALKDLDIARLGKSIDLLAKAKAVIKQINKKESDEETCVVCDAKLKDGKCSANNDHVQKAEGGMPAKGQPHAPAFQEPEQPMAPTKQVGQPKKPTRTVQVTKSQSERECAMCGKRQFKGNRFVGCFCLSDLAKSVKSQPDGKGGFTLEFRASLDADSVLTIMDALRGA